MICVSLSLSLSLSLPIPTTTGIHAASTSSKQMPGWMRSLPFPAEERLKTKLQIFSNALEKS
jgi:hypothetical protein